MLMALADDDLIMAGFPLSSKTRANDFSQVSKRGVSQQFGFRPWW
jgi:hypothetical protein